MQSTCAPRPRNGTPELPPEENESMLAAAAAAEAAAATAGDGRQHPMAMGRTVSSDSEGTSLGSVLRDFALVLAQEHDAEAILAELGRVTTKLLPSDGVGVLLRDPETDGLAVATANTEAGRIVEELEAELREGPCSDCMESGEQTAAPDLAAVTDRYPRFAPRAIEAGVRGAYGLPLTVRGQQFGSLNVVSFRPLELSATELATAQLVADVTSAYLANQQILHRSTTLTKQLQHALDSRVVVEQAKGMLAERRGIGLGDAFDRIRGHARANRIRVHDVATALLRGELDL